MFLSFLISLRWH